MKEMKAITINGVKYTVADPDAAHLLVVHADYDGVADHTAAEVYQHIQQGGTVVACYGSDYYQLDLSVPDSAEFTAYDGQEECIRGIWLRQDGSFAYREIPLATADAIGDMETALDSILDIQNALIGGDW